MNSNQATLEKLDRMGLRGMARAMRTTLEASPAGRLEPEELVSNLVDAEWEEIRDDPPTATTFPSTRCIS